MLLLAEILSEYTEEEKRNMGIPAGAVPRGGHWFVGNTRAGKVVNGKFVPVNKASDATTPQQDSPDSSSPPPATQQEQPAVPVVAAPTKENPSFDELRNEARQHRYTVMTRAPLGQIQSANPVDAEANAVGKPGGFWFAAGAEWVDWTAHEMPQWKGDNLYAVEVDESECLVIEDEFDFKDFTRTYGTRDFGIIDWGRVAQDHKGIIIRQYFPQFRLNSRYRWYYSWDVASGCVWDASAIRQVQQQSIQ